MINQLVIDGPQKGLTELELLKDSNIVVPNSYIDLNEMVTKVVDGKRLPVINAEISKLKQAIQESGSHYMYPIMPKKARDRETVLKKFQKI